MINQNYDFVNFESENVRQTVQAAFLDSTYTVVVVPAGTELWKLSQYPLPSSSPTDRLSPWWSTVRTFREDTLGVYGRFLEARLNGIPFTQMVRFSSAVRGDWNALDNYQEVMLLEDARGLWGQYEIQPMWSPVIERDNDAITAVRSSLNQSVGELPGTLGGNEAWQLWIPNLTINDVEFRLICDANDDQAMGARFNLL